MSKPLIEEHYHIQELIDAQTKRSEDRNLHRDRQKLKDERDQLIEEAKKILIMDFWCHICRKDFKSVSIKEVEEDWSCVGQRIAFYKAKCWLGHWCIRLITDKQRDGFWMRSKLCSLDRGNHFADTIQPHETGFNILYKKL